MRQRTPDIAEKLLNHYEIKTPMTSYHEHNKVDKARYLVKKLLEGKSIALITDAVHRQFPTPVRSWLSRLTKRE